MRLSVDLVEKSALMETKEEQRVLSEN